MKLVGFINDEWLSKKGKMKPGDIVVRVWKKWCRRATRKDMTLYGVVRTATKYEALVHWIRSDEIYSIKVK